MAPALRRHELDPDPLRQFRAWHHAAGDSSVVTLATATADGVPSARTVLLRGVDERGFVFYTGYGSRKASELDRPAAWAALLFHWDDPGRQVRVEGPVARVSTEESDAYFASRPRESRLGAWASHQGMVLESRAELDAALVQARERFADQEVPRPERWGGYRVAPERYEFWQQGQSRLHDRFRYRRDRGGWAIERLAP